MPNATLNGLAYTGAPGNHAVRTAPKFASRNPYKVGVAHIGGDGTINEMLGNSGLVRSVWELKWENIGTITRTALQALFAVAGTFPYVDEDGNSWTVLCLMDDYEEEHTDSIIHNAAIMKLYSVTIKLRD